MPELQGEEEQKNYVQERVYFASKGSGTLQSYDEGEIFTFVDGLPTLAQNFLQNGGILEIECLDGICKYFINTDTGDIMLIPPHDGVKPEELDFTGYDFPGELYLNNFLTKHGDWIFAPGTTVKMNFNDGARSFTVGLIPIEEVGALQILKASQVGRALS